MRLLVRGVLLFCLLLPAATPPGARALAGPDPCDMTLGPADVPPELQPERSANQSLNLSSDPNICERVFRAEPPVPSGMSEVRSVVILAASAEEASADYARYQAYLLEAGWQPADAPPLGEEAALFVGSDPSMGLPSLQQLFRRGNVMALTAVTGPAVQANLGLALQLAGVVDSRVAADLAAPGGSPPRGSIWPAVSAPAMVADGRLGSALPIGMSLGLGGFSGLVSLDREGTRFITLTDRGPNLESGSGKHKILLFPMPDFTPSIVKIELQNGQIVETERIKLRLPDGYVDPRTGSPFVSGLPNVAGADPPAFDLSGRRQLGTDPYGLDTEGIALDPRDGSYWICEEYGPSVLHVASDGTILLRLMPSGAGVNAPGQGVRAILPGELAKRKPNRGFEGVAISPDGARLFAIMQSPLSNPDKDTGEASRNVRLLTLDLSGPEPWVDGMYVYRTQPFSQVGAAEQDDVKVGDMAALSAGRVLVAERDSAAGGGFKMVYRVDLGGATNILGRGDFGGRALEQAEEGDLARLGIQPVAKAAVVNVADLGWRLEKFEGLAIVDESTIAAVNDDDFGVSGFDNGRPQSNGVATELSIIHLPGSLTE